MHFRGEILFFEMRELADYFEVRGLTSLGIGIEDPLSITGCGHPAVT